MTPSAPHLSWSSRLYGNIAVKLARLPRPMAWIVAIGGSIATLAVEMVTGNVYNLGICYLLSLALIAWSLEERYAIVLALAFGTGEAAIQCRAQLQHLSPDATALSAWLNFGLQIALTYLLISFFNAMRSAIARERWRASTDALTGLLNKTAFEKKMTGKVCEAQARNGALVLAYMDLDGFKAVNDHHGHSAGDRVLKAFAKAASEAVREGDLFARIGGDEFAALLIVPSIAEGDRVAVLVHERLSAILAGTGMGVTCSTGALVMEAAQLEPADSYVELADKLMYEVKQGGKNALRIGRVDPIGAVLRSAFPPAEPQFELPVPAQPRLMTREGRQAA